MDNSISTIIKLYEKYSHSEKTIEYINDYINNMLPLIVENIYDNNTNINKIMKETNKYIQNFLSNQEKQIFYIDKTDIFIIYNNHNFNVISEDKIWHMIFSDISNKPLLTKKKIFIKDKIIEKVKQNSLFKSIPESNTIQEIIKLLFILFNNKNEIKYFLTLLGDNLLKKNKSLIHYCNPSSKIFFDLLQQYSVDFFKNNNILNSIRFKYHGYDYKNIRILHINKQIKNYYGLPIFMKSNFFNLISVACYYSNRYENSEFFVNNDMPLYKKNKICYLENKTPHDIIDNFIELFITKTSSVEDIINKKDMSFLWNNYLNKMNLPNIIYKNNLQKILEEKLIFDENFRKVTNPLLSNIKYIKQFWQTTIQMGDLIETDLEISEFIKLFNKWCKLNNKEINEFEEFETKEILEYYFTDIKIIDEKYILNIKCNLWCKEDDVIDFINNIKINKKISDEISLFDLYKLYCEFSKSNNKDIIVSKKFFEKNILKLIPSIYIQNNIILTPFWCYQI